MLRQQFFPRTPSNSPFDAPHRRLHRSRLIRAATENESDFEIDREQAREALRKLDEQIQSISRKQRTPKKRASPADLEPYLDRELMTGAKAEQMPEISGSYLAYSAFALLLFTIAYNLVFIFYIKPAVDGPEVAPSNGVVIEQAPPLASKE